MTGDVVGEGVGWVGGREEGDGDGAGLEVGVVAVMVMVEDAGWEEVEEEAIMDPVEEEVMGRGVEWAAAEVAEERSG